jgi:hypothetical protein
MEVLHHEVVLLHLLIDPLHSILTRASQTLVMRAEKRIGLENQYQPYQKSRVVALIGDEMS